MANFSYKQLKELVEFQEIDLETDRKNARLNEIPGEIEKLQKQLKEARDELDKVAQMIEDQNKSRRSKERGLETNTEKLNRYQVQLYQLKSNKEYQAMLQEIEDLKAANDRIEEEILIMLEESEQLKNRQSQAKEDCNTKTAQIEKLIQNKENERRTLLGRMDELHELRDAKKKLIDSKLLANYEKLWQNLGPARVVVPVLADTCQGCNISQRPQYLFEIKTQEGIFHCESCHRIIYFPEQIRSDT